MATQLRLMTMNMASGSGDPYVDFTAQAHARFINQVNPDVVFLQELDRATSRASGVDQLAVLRESTPLSDSHFVKWRNLEGGQYGIAMISRFPLENVENRSVYKPPEWWPWFVTQVVTPVAYAEITVGGTRLHLYNTHFPSSDEGRKKYGADQIAARIPTNSPTVLGGDFNDGPGGEAMAAIDAKLIPAESIAGKVVVEEGGSFLDHFYVAGGVACGTWYSVAADEQPRGKFSDHPIIYADLQIPTSMTVPDVVGDSAVAARNALELVGFSVSQRLVVDHTCNAIGDVIDQSPRGGTLAAAGSTVTISIGERPPHPCP